ncbi:MAG: type II toxin-antitoxin system VapC family toxin [Thermoguttaceae bacterium]
MILADLAAGRSVFVDANVLVYYFAPDPVFGPHCAPLLQRIEIGELFGFTSTHVLTETAHRLMGIEASARFGWPFAGMARRLRDHAAEVQKLMAFRRALQTVMDSKVHVLSITPALVLTAAGISQQTGLLSNDALIVAAMQNHGLNNLASNDADFDRVSGLTRYAPA